MKKALALLLFAVFFLSVSAPEAATRGRITGMTKPKKEPGPELALTAGLRTDNFDWSISDSDGDPNILSELTWSDLRIYQIKASTRLVMNGPFYMRGHLGYGWIWDGDNQDSDYNGDNRTNEYSRSNNASDGGEVWDASAAIGYTLDIAAIEVSPLLGYSYHAQYLQITDGYQVICDAAGSPRSCTSPPLGSFAGLDSSYDALWYGPWLGIDLRYKTRNRRLTLYGTFELHLVLYRAEANWNLRDAFQHPISFEHTGDGEGVLISVGGDYDIGRGWSLLANIDADAWRVKGGLDKTFNSDGTISATSVHRVNWDSVAFMTGLKYRY
ncbi:MAG: hypothetical protein V3V95_05565 [Thermodesulfobacteriota bacterium]